MKLALKIHVSEACKQILDKMGGYILKDRGVITVKVSTDCNLEVIINNELNLGKGRYEDILAYGQSGQKHNIAVTKRYELNWHIKFEHS